MRYRTRRVEHETYADMSFENGLLYVRRHLLKERKVQYTGNILFTCCILSFGIGENPHSLSGNALSTETEAMGRDEMRNFC